MLEVDQAGHMRVAHESLGGGLPDASSLPVTFRICLPISYHDQLVALESAGWQLTPL
jgi:hypothetical protein